MRRIQIWLLERTRIRTAAIFWLIVLTVIRDYVISDDLRLNDYYTPLLYLVMMGWVYYSVFYRVIIDEDVDEKVILKRPLKSTEFIGNLPWVAILLYFSYRTFLVFGEWGALLILSLITLTLGLHLYMYLWKIILSKQPADRTVEAGMMIIIVLLYFGPWKSIYCHQYGVQDRHSYFEKESYQGEYLVSIERTDDGNNYHLPAHVEVNTSAERDKILPSVFYGLIGTFIQDDDYRTDRVTNVYFDNGGSLYFENCKHYRTEGKEFTCIDQDGEEWSMEIMRGKQ